MLQNLNQKFAIEEVLLDEYKCPDLGVSSILFVNGLSLKRIEKVNSICYFVFSNLEECRKVSIDYWNNHCFVDARSFNQANAILKNRMFIN